LISTKIPDKVSDPFTFDTVWRSMMHGPYGTFMPNASYMKNEKYSKRYSWSFQENTIENEDSYSIYKYRNNGRTVEVRGIWLDNRWVVPYNPYLITKYDCYINMKICSSITIIKYLFKYIFKGHDRVIIEIRGNNT